MSLEQYGQRSTTIQREENASPQATTFVGLLPGTLLYGTVFVHYANAGPGRVLNGLLHEVIGYSKITGLVGALKLADAFLNLPASTSTSIAGLEVRISTPFIRMVFRAFRLSNLLRDTIILCNSHGLISFKYLLLLEYTANGDCTHAW